MTDTTNPEGKPLCHQALKFVADGGDFTIVCGDDRWMAKPQNENGALNAFIVYSKELVKHSDFFEDMLQLGREANEDGEQTKARIEIEERAHIVGYVLSAAWERSRTLLATCKSWEDLNLALQLAVKWRMEHARTGIFFAMQDWLLRINTPQLAADFKLEVVNVLVEGVKNGDNAVSSIVWILKLNAGLDPPVVFRMMPLNFSEIHFLEIGASGCSKVAREIMRLVENGLLNSSY